MKKNIVLIGMPAAGKSTISNELSKVLKMVRYDVDKLIEFNENKTVTEIFETKGENYFRKIEEKIIKKLSNLNGIIISTNEGSILNNINLKNLKKNGIIFLIERNIENIYNSNHSRRPILKDDRAIVYKMYKERYKKYKQSADYTIKNEYDKLNEVVYEIKKIYEKIENRRKWNK